MFVVSSVDFEIKKFHLKNFFLDAKLLNIENSRKYEKTKIFLKNKEKENKKISKFAFFFFISHLFFKFKNLKKFFMKKKEKSVFLVKKLKFFQILNFLFLTKNTLFSLFTVNSLSFLVKKSCSILFPHTLFDRSTTPPSYLLPKGEWGLLTCPHLQCSRGIPPHFSPPGPTPLCGLPHRGRGGWGRGLCGGLGSSAEPRFYPSAPLCRGGWGSSAKRGGVAKDRFPLPPNKGK